MRIFMDTEFIERGPSLPIEFISIGMVRQDGATLYLINGDVSLSNIYKHPWLQMNVWPHLPVLSNDHAILQWDENHEDYHRVMDIDSIGTRIIDFVTEGLKNDPSPVELWGYYCGYDYVVLSQIYGGMTGFPSVMPMFMHDIMQEWMRLGRPDVLHDEQESNLPHHALADAESVARQHAALRAHEARLLRQANNDNVVAVLEAFVDEATQVLPVVEQEEEKS